MENQVGLSKSRYCSAVQCPKTLWLSVHKPELMGSAGAESVLTNGTMVGEVARGYFGEYALVSYSGNKQQMVEDTFKLMESGAETIAEGSIVYDGLYCAVDLLHKNGDGWDIVEVKSSTSVTETYLQDMAFQYYVLKNAGVPVKDVYMLYINNKYVRHGELNLKELFILENHTEDAMSREAQVGKNIDEFREYASQEQEPEKDIDLCCEVPYACAYKAYCGRNLPKPSIFDVAGLTDKKAYQLYHSGIKSFEDVIEKKVKLTERQLLQVERAVNHLPAIIHKDKIQDFLSTLRYPLYYLDFETFQQAIPEFEGGKPYEQIPFQYSLHVEYEDGRLEHLEFLAKEGTDPRRAVAERLCEDIPMGVCSLAYNMSFEKSRIKTFAEQYPDLAEHLMDIHDHMVDPEVIFAERDYYNNAMKGKSTIKLVLPALYPNDPELDYHNLEDVHNGGEASAAFLTMADKSPEEIARLRENLLKYCGLDTYAMVKLIWKLREAVKDNN